MKLAKIVDEKFYIALEKLSVDALPLRTAFRLKGIMNIAKEESRKYEEVRKQALMKYGKKKEDGELVLDEKSCVQFDPEGLQAFATELNELGGLEIEVPKIKLSELGDNIIVTVEDLEALDGVISED